MSEKKKEKLSKLALNEGKVSKIALVESKVETGSGTKKKRSLSLKEMKAAKETDKVESEDDDPGRLITPYQRPKENSSLTVPNLESDREHPRLSKRFIKSLRESPLKGLVPSESSDSGSDSDLSGLIGKRAEAPTNKTQKSPKPVVSPNQKAATPVKSSDSQRRHSQSAAPLFSFLSSKSPAKSPDKVVAVRSRLFDVIANTSPIKPLSSQESVSMVTSTQKSPAALRSPPFCSRDTSSSEDSDDEVETAASAILDKSRKGRVDAASSSGDEGPQGQALLGDSAESSDSDGGPKAANQPPTGSVGQGTAPRAADTSSSEDEEPPDKKDGRDSDKRQEPLSAKQSLDRSRERPEPEDSDDSDSREAGTDKRPRAPSPTNESSDSESGVDTTTPARPLFAVEKAKIESTEVDHQKSLHQSVLGEPAKVPTPDSSSDDGEPPRRLFPSKQDLNKPSIKSASLFNSQKPPVNPSAFGRKQTTDSSSNSSSDDEAPPRPLSPPKQDVNKPAIGSSSSQLGQKKAPNQSVFGGAQTKDSSSDSSSDDEAPPRRLSPPKQVVTKPLKESSLSQLGQKKAPNQSVFGGAQTKDSSSDSSSDDEAPPRRLSPPKQDVNKPAIGSSSSQLGQKKAPNQSAFGGEQTKDSSSDSSSYEEPPRRLVPPKKDPSKPGVKGTLTALSLKKPVGNQTFLDASMQARSPLACSTPTNDDPKSAPKNALIRSVFKAPPGSAEQTPKPQNKKSKPKQSHPNFEIPQVSEKRNKSDSGVDVRRSVESDSDDLEDSLRAIAERVYSDSISSKTAANEKAEKEVSKKKSKLAIPQAKIANSAVVPPSTLAGDATSEELLKKIEQKTTVKVGDEKPKKRKLEESGQDGHAEGSERKEGGRKKRKLFSTKTDDSFKVVNNCLGLGNISETKLVSKLKQTDAKAEIGSRGSSPLRGAVAKKEKKGILFGNAKSADTHADSKNAVSAKKKRSKKQAEMDDSIDEILSLVVKNIGIDKPKKKKKKKEKDLDLNTSADRMPPPDATSIIPKKTKNSTEMPTGSKEGFVISGPSRGASKPQTEGEASSKKKSKKKEAMGSVSGQSSDLPMPSAITQVNHEPSKSQELKEPSSKKKSKKMKGDVISFDSGKTSENYVQLRAVITPETRANVEIPNSDGEAALKKKSKKKDAISVGSEETSDRLMPIPCTKEARIQQEPSKSEEVREASSKKKSKKKKKKEGVIRIDSRQSADVPALTAVMQETQVNQEPPKSGDAGESSSEKKSKKKKAYGLVSGPTASDDPQPAAVTQEPRLNPEPLGESSSKRKSKRKKEDAVSIGSGGSADVRLSLPVHSEVPAKKKKMSKMEKTEKLKPKSGSKSLPDSDDSDDEELAGYLKKLLKKAEPFVNNEVAEKDKTKTKGRAFIKKSKKQ